MLYALADTTTNTAGLCDEGRGLVFKENEYQISKGLVDSMLAEGIRPGAWMENMGGTEAYIGALHQLENGGYEEVIPGVPKVMGHPL